MEKGNYRIYENQVMLRAHLAATIIKKCSLHVQIKEK
jgi:hypothetical protein